jgi:flavin reductase (DIM6/NTAB) family NADH-FMN oxidoreductase RutF
MNLQKYFDSIPASAAQMEKGAFLVAGGDTVNPMTIGWAQFGWIWGKPVVMVMVRKSRFTYGLMELAAHFSVCVPAHGEMKAALGYCGAHSGREGDKGAAAGLTFAPAKTYQGKVVSGCGAVYECRRVFRGESDLSYMDQQIRERFYGANQAGGEGDPHVLYFGEVAEVYGTILP